MKFNEYQEKWLQLMETTELPQAKGILYNGNGYCCLGLCMRFVENIEPEYHSDEFWLFEGENTALTGEAIKHLGLWTRLGRLISRTHDFYTHLKKCGYSGGIEFSLSAYNDNGATFKQIAVAIRACPEAVFKNFNKGNHNSFIACEQVKGGISSSRKWRTTMTRTNLAYHFTKDTLRDGSPIPPIGEWLEHKGNVVLCGAGLHFSRHPFDALTYAPGTLLHLVEVDDIVEEDKSKGVCRRRKIIATINAENLLRECARKWALDVIDKWDAPDVVIQWLKTGDESLRLAAYSAAYSAVAEAAYSAAYSAVAEAAYLAAYSAAYSATYSVAEATASATASAAASAAYLAVAKATAKAVAEAAIESQREHFAEKVNEAFKRRTTMTQKEVKYGIYKTGV